MKKRKGYNEQDWTAASWPNRGLAAIEAYNSMHAGQRVQVEWGIGGLKRKWRRMMKRFDAKLYQFSNLFYACAILTNFIHRRRGEMTNIVEDCEAGWDGDY